MAEENKSVLFNEVVRDLTLSLEPLSGGLTLFFAYVNGAIVIQADGTKTRVWSGKIPEAQVRVKIRVVGIDNASFKLGIDLPETADDQNLTLQLKGGYYEMEITL